MTKKSDEMVVTDEQMNELKEHFHIFDLNGSGWIEEDDLKTALEIIGQPKDNYQVRKLLRSIDTDTDGRISFDEYIDWNRQLFIDEMKLKFKELDKNNDGHIDKVEMKEFAIELGYGVTEEEIDQLTYEMDVSQDGKIDVDEFIAAMARGTTGRAYYVVNGELYLLRMESDFKAIDKDGSGYVDKEELRQMAHNLCYAISDEELDILMHDMDDDKDGKISLQEFIAATVKNKTG